METLRAITAITLPSVAEASSNKFSNCRDWRSFLTAAQCAVVGPSLATALQAGHQWLSGGAAKTYRWLFIDGTLVAGARKTLGI
jgi:hypothetical protein